MMYELLSYNGFDATVNYQSCHVAYLGSVHFVVKTGSAPDWFNATEPWAPVNFTFGGGDDIGIWNHASAGSFFNADMGTGRDKLMLNLPVGAPIVAALGNEMQVDSVDLYPNNLPPTSIATDKATASAVIGPIGLNGETLTLLEYHPPYDLAHVRKGVMGGPITLAETIVPA